MKCAVAWCRVCTKPRLLAQLGIKQPLQCHAKQSLAQPTPVTGMRNSEGTSTKPLFGTLWVQCAPSMLHFKAQVQAKDLDAVPRATGPAACLPTQATNNLQHLQAFATKKQTPCHVTRNSSSLSNSSTTTQWIMRTLPDAALHSASAAAACCASWGLLWLTYSRSNWRHTGSSSGACTAAQDKTPAARTAVGC